MTAVDRTVGSAELIEVAPGIHAYVQPDGGWCLSNAGLITDGGEAVLIDTAATERRARHLYAAVTAAAGTAPRTVVNTHFHGDHTFGNFLFRPEATVIAHEAGRTEAATAALGLCGLWPEVGWGSIRLTLPTLTYRRSLTLHVGRLRIELFHPGPAHTTGDTVVWVPEHRVLFTGDIAMHGATPFCLMGSVAGSLRTIERLRRLDPRTVVTGHGRVSGPRVLDETAAYLRWVRRLAVDGVRRGRGPLAVAREADLGGFAALLDPERLVGNLHRAYAEVRGEPLGAALDVLSIFQEMVSLHGGPLPCHA